MFPSTAWVFLSQGTDTTTNIQYGIRYHLQSISQQTIFYLTRTLPGTAYSATPATQAFWGGAINHPGTGSTRILSYVRFFLDYVPNSRDQMINLAMMSPDCRYPLTSSHRLILLYFSRTTLSTIHH